MFYVKVRLLTNDHRGEIGNEVELPAAIAAVYISADRAEYVEQEVPAEKEKAGSIKK